MLRFRPVLPAWIAALILALSQAHADPTPEDPTELVTQVEELLQKGESERALPLAERALELSKSSLPPEDPKLARALRALARAELDEDDLESAEPLLLRALEIHEKSIAKDPAADVLPLARTLLDLAVAYLEQDQAETAKPLLVRARELSEKALQNKSEGAALVLGEALFERALLHRDDDEATSAKPLLLRALELGKGALSETHPLVLEVQKELGSLHLELGEIAEAESLLRKALTALDAHPEADPVLAADILSLLALAQLDKDHKHAERDAEKLLLRALELLSHFDEDSRRAEIFYELAELYWYSDEPEKAITAAGRGLRLREREVAETILETGSERRKTRTMRELLGEIDGIVSLHLNFAEDSEDAARLAFEAIVHNKGRVQDVMSDSLAALRESDDPEDKALLKELAHVQSKLSNLLVRGHKKLTPERYRALASELRAKKEQLESKISEESAEIADLRRAASLEEIKAALPRESALIEIFVYHPYDPEEEDALPARYVAYVLTHTGLRYRDLGPVAEIDASLKKLLTALADEKKDPKALAGEAHQKIFQPLIPLLDDKRWIFVSPDGLLNQLPLGALVNGEGRYLLEQYAFSYLTSGRDLLRFAARREASASPPLLIGGPEFGEWKAPKAPKTPPGRGHASRAIDMSKIKFPPLAGTIDETRAIARKLEGARLLLGPEASEATLKKTHGPRILHLATHGFFLPRQKKTQAPEGRAATKPFSALSVDLDENPLLRSGLALSGANLPDHEDEDGILTALEVSSLDLHDTQLVVLSACETGLGEIEDGEGVYGLRRALVLAGADTLMMSLWKVSDEATRDLMLMVYDRIEQGEGRGEALRKAQLALLAQPGRSHPFYWAAFITSGNPASLDGRVTPPSFARVNPGPRGCGCRLGDTEDKSAPPLALAALFVLATAMRLRSRMFARSPSPKAVASTAPPR